MFTNKYKRPLYFKRSKAAKQKEQEYQISSDSETSFTEYPQEYNRSPRARRVQKYYGGYLYSDDEDQYNRYGIYENQNTHNTSEDLYEYSTEDSRYQRYPTQTETYTATESTYFEESDSDCKTCQKRRVGRSRRVADTSDPSLHYKYREHQPRPRTIKYGHKNERPKPIETKRSPNRKKFDVYRAHQQAGHRAFSYKQRREQTESESDNTHSDSDEVSDGEDRNRPNRNQPEYHVYSAHFKKNTTGVFDNRFNRGSRERMLSVTEYNENVPMKALKDQKPKDIKGVPCDVVYMPVAFLNNSAELPKSKIISPELVMFETGEQAEKPLETGMQVYAATDIGISNNIFQQEKIIAERENPEPSLAQNIPIYTDQEQSNPMDTNKSLASLVNKNKTNEEVEHKSEYPVKKSYINVAPSNLKHSKGIDRVNSKTSIRPVGSPTSIRTIIGVPKPGSPKGSSFYSQAHKKYIQAKKDRKNRNKGHGENDSNASTMLNAVDLSQPDVQNKQKNEQSEDHNAVIKEPRTTTVVNNGVHSLNRTNENKTNGDVVHNASPPRTSEVHKPATTNSHQPVRASIVGEALDKSAELKHTRKSIVEESINVQSDRKTPAEEIKSLDNKQKNGVSEGRKSLAAEEKNTPHEHKKSLTKTESRSQSIKPPHKSPEPQLLPVESTHSLKSPSKRSLVSKIFHKNKSKKDAQPSVVFPQPESRNILRSISEVNEPHRTQETTSILPAENGQQHTASANVKSKKLSKKSLASKPTVEFTEEKDSELSPLTPEDKTLKMWGYDLKPIIYVFQMAQFFLGLSIHNKLMEVLTTFQSNDLT